MNKQLELTEIRIRFQHNGEGAVHFAHAERVRDGDQVYSAGEEKRAGIRFEDFRSTSFAVALASGAAVNITGRDFESLCTAIGTEMERQAADRERKNTEAAERLRDAERQHAEEVAAIERDGAGKAKRV